MCGSMYLYFYVHNILPTLLYLHNIFYPSCKTKWPPSSFNWYYYNIYHIYHQFIYYIFLSPCEILFHFIPFQFLPFFRFFFISGIAAYIILQGHVENIFSLTRIPKKKKKVGRGVVFLFSEILFYTFFHYFNFDLEKEDLMILRRRISGYSLGFPEKELRIVVESRKSRCCSCSFSTCIYPTHHHFTHYDVISTFKLWWNKTGCFLFFLGMSDQSRVLYSV